MLNSEDKKDVKNAMGRAVANKVSKATNDSAKKLTIGQKASQEFYAKNPGERERMEKSFPKGIGIGGNANMKKHLGSGDAKNKAIHAKSSRHSYYKKQFERGEDKQAV